MNVKLLLIFMAIVFMILLGCGNNDSTPSDPTPPSINRAGTYKLSSTSDNYVYQNGVISPGLATSITGTLISAFGVDYEIIDLGFTAGDMKINNRDQIAGTFTVSPNVYHAFLYEKNTLTDLGTIANNYSAARDINNNGWIVGESGPLNTFLYMNNTMTNLGPVIGGLYNRPYAINDIGQIVGTYDPSPDYSIYGRAYIYDSNNNSMQDIGTLGGKNSVAYAINNSGKVVGYSYNASNIIRAFLYSDNVMTDIGALGTYSFATGINDNGQIIGHSNAGSGEHAFLYSDGIMKDLGTLGGTHSYAQDINNKGQVVGFAYDDTHKYHAFLYESGLMIDLGTLGGDESRATGINEHGKIVGWSKTDAGEIHAVIWQPKVLPEPIISVDIDIKPGSYPNNINLRNKGVVTVAVLTTNKFDATTIDPSAVTFGQNHALEADGKGHIEDVDGDGDLDLVLHFRTEETGIECGDKEAGLTGKTFDGHLIDGVDSVQTAQCK